MKKEFEFTVVLTVPDGTDSLSEITYSVSGDEGAAAVISSVEDTAVISVTLGKGETLTIENLPAGMGYMIYENADGYTQTVTGENVVENAEAVNADGETVNVGTAVTGTVTAGDADTAEFTNSRVVEVDTGIRLDSVPYVVILSVVLLGAGAAAVKKRFSVND